MIKVYLMLRKGRTCFECQWTDPVTRKKKTKSTNTTKRREAERFLGSLQSDLNAGRHSQSPSNITWQSITDRYENEVLASRAQSTLRKFVAAKNAFRTLIDPHFASVITSSLLSQFQDKMRRKKKAEATIKSTLSALRSCFNWAKRMNLMETVPYIEMPKRTAKMKGRPITGEEFDRMIAALPNCHLGNFVDSWESLLRGLWWSGLRLSEALNLHWTTGGITVNLAAGRPRLKIEENADKSTKARLLPLAPEFAELLLAVPEGKRRGSVWNPIVPGQLATMRLDTCSKVIAKIGKKANIIVAETNGKKKYASAHDLRRAFGTRWAKKMKPNQLKDLMRHETIQTTMTFYVEEPVAEIELAMGESANTFANNSDVSHAEK